MPPCGGALKSLGLEEMFEEDDETLPVWVPRELKLSLSRVSSGRARLHEWGSPSWERAGLIRIPVGPGASGGVEVEAYPGSLVGALLRLQDLPDDLAV